MNSRLETWINRADEAAEVLRQAAPLIIEGLSAETKTQITDFASSELGVRAKDALTKFRIAGDLAQKSLPVLLEKTVVRPVAAAGQAVGQKVNYRLETALSAAETRAGEMLAEVVRSRRIEERNSLQGREQRREAAQAAMGTVKQREMREIFEEDPNGVMQALDFPDLNALEQGFHSQARVTTEYSPYIPLGEQQLGVVEFDPDDPRIKEFQGKLGVKIYPMVGRDGEGEVLEVYDWERLPRDDGSGRRLTGPLEPPVQDGEGKFVHQAGHRTVMVPNIPGATARSALRRMAQVLDENLDDKRTASIIARSDEIAERSRSYIPPDKLADLFSLARTRPDLSPYKIVKMGLQTDSPKLDPSRPSKLESVRRKWWRRKPPIGDARFKARRS